MTRTGAREPGCPSVARTSSLQEIIRLLNTCFILDPFAQWSEVCFLTRENVF